MENNRIFYDKMNKYVRFGKDDIMPNELYVELIPHGEDDPNPEEIVERWYNFEGQKCEFSYNPNDYKFVGMRIKPRQAKMKAEGYSTTQSYTKEIIIPREWFEKLKEDLDWTGVLPYIL